MAMPIIEQEKQLFNNMDHVIQPVDKLTPPTDHVTSQREEVDDVVNVHTSDDDDDDLIPFQITPQHNPNVAHYLREAIAGTPS